MKEQPSPQREEDLGQGCGQGVPQASGSLSEPLPGLGDQYDHQPSMLCAMPLAPSPELPGIIAHPSGTAQSTLHRCSGLSLQTVPSGCQGHVAEPSIGPGVLNP